MSVRFNVLKSAKIYLGILLSFTLWACGGDSNSSNSNMTQHQPNLQGPCAVGQVHSQQYGCLQQGHCPVGQGLVGNTCVSVQTQPYVQGPTTGQVGACQGTCSIPGYVMTEYGCLPQYNCPPCSGWLNNQCHRGNPHAGIGYGSARAPEGAEIDQEFDENEEE